ncbi:TIGR03943 family protein [Sporosarcina sp. P13]|uniref:TIGR03943 family putative permease subunit n=1 Tax=Sporosarcina sp. P13 TaxID=2048263 RepID=UPI000C172CD6|nr:TIGR03943 family protein [Sporosarcina sp. P13]PIC62868.1 TIGR03943 family protein [Sporosarcina sp. P13]
MNSRKSTVSLQFHMFLRGIILIGFFLLILKFVVNETIHLYIAPKMLPFVYFAGGCFFIIGVFQFFKSMSSNLAEDIECNCGVDHYMKGSFIGKTIIYLLFILPIIFGLGFPQSIIDSSVAANKGIQYGGGLYNYNQKNSATMLENQKYSSTIDMNEHVDDLEEYLVETDQQDASKDMAEDIPTPLPDTTTGEYNIYSVYDEFLAEYSEMDHIEVTDENYLDVISVINIYLDKFVGKTLTMKGFVYREPDFNEQQIVVARFAMNCCVADASVFGTIVESDQVQSYETDSWIEVTGTINETSYKGQKVMRLSPDQIVKIDTPKDPYVYPYY